MPWMEGYPYYLIMGSVLSLYMGVSSAKQRRTPGRRFLWILLLLVSFMFAATAGEILADRFRDKLWWKNAQQVPLFLSTIFLYAVIKDYVSRSTEGLAAKLAWFCVPVFADILLIVTDTRHHLMRSSVSVQTVHGISGIAVEPTTLSMLLIAYDQLFALYAVYLLFLSLINAPKHAFKRNLLFLLALSIPVLFSLVLPFTRITLTGLTALTYIPPIIAGYVTLFRDPRLSLYPLAKNKILEHMKDGIVLTNRYDQIIEVNESGSAILSALAGEPPDGWMGQSISPLLDAHRNIAEPYAGRREVQLEIEASKAEGICYGVSLIAVEREGRTPGGMLLVFSDLSEKKRYERELYHQATVDDLTGLYNRRHFMRLVRLHLIQGAGMALFLFDIDDFKKINDTYGHMGGDQALVELSRKIRKMYKHKGIAGRVGGEEFAVCFFAGSEEEAWKEAERFRQTVSEHIVHLEGGQKVKLTVSIGIAFLDDGNTTFEDLYREADAALYISKSSGKNRATIGRAGNRRRTLEG